MWDDYLLVLLSPLKFQKQAHTFPLPYVCLFPHKNNNNKNATTTTQNSCKSFAKSTLVYYEKLDSNPLSPLL